jgi:hypothetical protein
MTIPPLLMLAAGRKPRLRKAPMARPKEIGLHMSVAAMLREHGRPDWQWTHIAHGEARDPRVAGKLKQMGLRPGWPDFVLVAPTGKLHCIELKRLGGTLSDAQEDFKFWCVRHGVPHVTAHSMDHVLIAFDAWDCLSIKIAGAVRKGGAHD